jgi:hypothetical protein
MAAVIRSRGGAVFVMEKRVLGGFAWPGFSAAQVAVRWARVTVADDERPAAMGSARPAPRSPIRMAAESDLIQFSREMYQKRPIVSDMTDL